MANPEAMRLRMRDAINRLPDGHYAFAEKGTVTLWLGHTRYWINTHKWKGPFTVSVRQDRRAYKLSTFPTWKAAVQAIPVLALLKPKFESDEVNHE